ncbi:MAG: response regulator [Sphingobacteriaceae bacterium]|nr:response regulator [Sphingobacteriaceae bacterium]
MNRVLIIEDEVQLRENIMELFQSQHYQVESADNGKSGYEKALKFFPDLIVSDVIMPEEDGFALLLRLKKNPATEFVPVIFLTAKTMMESKIEGLQLGADDYIVKPFSAEELLARSSNLIQKHQKMLKKGLIAVSEDNIIPKSEQMIRDIIQYIEEHLSDYNLSVDMIAKHLGISKSTIQRKIKSSVNKNLNQLIREYRLEKARKMIERNAGTLSDIAQTTGFNSLSYFSYSYKKFYGIAPSQSNR